MRRNETHQTTYMQAMGMCLVEDDVSSSGKQALVLLLPLTSQDVQHTFSHDVCLDTMYRRPYRVPKWLCQSRVSPSSFERNSQSWATSFALLQCISIQRARVWCCQSRRVSSWSVGSLSGFLLKSRFSSQCVKQILDDDVYPATMYRHPGIFLKCGVPNNRHQRIKYILGRRLLPCDNISMSSEQDLWAADLIPLRMVLPSKMSGFALPQHIDIWEPMGLEHSGKCGAQRYSDVRDASSENGLRKLLYWPQGQ
ncbi:hypothetical protein IW262DRAFT_1299270 [Armillaria fumosa]|nr:hypothetical protein IW262DRAFT_1299267 [Armillaria fumosa]KAK0215992.1 hypothetical protein IW262DRAFT_1299270 [Armillaria fumosa]